MSNIAKSFETLRQTGQKGFIPFITAGDPDLDTTLAIMKELADLGSTVIELGVPFTDPMADGPVIQASSQRALVGVKPVAVRDVLDLVREFRKYTDIPVVLFGYLNPFLSFGIKELAVEGKAAGIDGILVTDVVDDEFRELSSVFGESAIDMISLVAPTTSSDRLERLVAEAKGFIYAVSTRGVTGSDTSFDEAKQLVERIKTATEIPVAVGFGVSKREHIVEIFKFADAAVVGSAIVKVIAAAGSPDQCADDVREFVMSLLETES